VREGCHIGPWSLVGMGSVVTTDVPEERVWFGSPARDVRRAPLPWGAVEAADVVAAPVPALAPQPVPENSLSSLPEKATP
jgi:serine acetyltransferase